MTELTYTTVVRGRLIKQNVYDPIKRDAANRCLKRLGIYKKFWAILLEFIQEHRISGRVDVDTWRHRGRGWGRARKLTAVVVRLPYPLTQEWADKVQVLHGRLVTAASVIKRPEIFRRIVFEGRGADPGGPHWAGFFAHYSLTYRVWIHALEDEATLLSRQRRFAQHDRHANR